MKLNKSHLLKSGEKLSPSRDPSHWNFIACEKGKGNEYPQAIKHSTITQSFNILEAT